MKKYLIYFNVIGVVKTYLVARKIFMLAGDDVYEIKKQFALIDDDGEKIENPIIKGTKMVLMIPIPPSAISNGLVDEYVQDQKSIIDVVFAYALVSSFIDVKAEEKYTEKKELVYVVTFSLKKRQLFISLSIYFILTILFSTILFFL